MFYKFKLFVEEYYFIFFNLILSLGFLIQILFFLNFSYIFISKADFLFFSFLFFYFSFFLIFLKFYLFKFLLFPKKVNSILLYKRKIYTFFIFNFNFLFFLTCAFIYIDNYSILDAHLDIGT